MILNNLKSFLDCLFSYRQVDEHIIIKVFGLKFCKKVKVDAAERAVTEFGLSTEKRTPRIILSLTTFPDRINIVHKTISTLLTQTTKPDAVILWLADSQFPDKKLPESLLRLQIYGLTIKWCSDIRSYKKLIPALKEYPDDIIITVDDDYYYPENLIETLMEEHKRYPDCIIGGRAMVLKGKFGKIKLKRRSYVYDSSYLPSYRNPFIGFGGVLYPPHSLHEDVFDSDKFMTLVPTNDDAWFWINAVRKGTKFVPAKDGYKLNYYLVEGSQKTGLFQINTVNSQIGLCGQDAANMFLKMYDDGRKNFFGN